MSFSTRWSTSGKIMPNEIPVLKSRSHEPQNPSHFITLNWPIWEHVIFTTVFSNVKFVDLQFSVKNGLEFSKKSSFSSEKSRYFACQLRAIGREFCFKTRIVHSAAVSLFQWSYQNRLLDEVTNFTSAWFSRFAHVTKQRLHCANDGWVNLGCGRCSLLVRLYRRLRFASFAARLKVAGFWNASKRRLPKLPMMDTIQHNPAQGGTSSAANLQKP